MAIENIMILLLYIHQLDLQTSFAKHLTCISNNDFSKGTLNVQLLLGINIKKYLLVALNNTINSKTNCAYLLHP